MAGAVEEQMPSAYVFGDLSSLLLQSPSFLFNASLKSLSVSSSYLIPASRFIISAASYDDFAEKLWLERHKCMKFAGNFN